MRRHAAAGPSTAGDGSRARKRRSGARRAGGDGREAAEQTLGRSLAIRHVDAGSCNGCELEIHALSNAFYDIERFGFRFVASPRHADVLLVTGPVTRNMREALKRTYDATPAPKWVVASGVCASTAACFAGSYAVAGGVVGRGSGRSRHSRLPAEPGHPAQGVARADARRPVRMGSGAWQ